LVSLRISGLTHEFDEREVFSAIDFEFDGGCLAVIGANGSGKSTLLRIIAGLLVPTEGEARVLVDGQPVCGGALRDAIGLAAPDVHLYSELTPRENLRFLVDARALPGREALVDEALREVGLDHRADDPVGELSSGLRRRACLAAAIIHRPPLLLLDEPGANLDDEGAAIVRGIVDRYQRAGMVVVATNDRAEADLGQECLSLGVVS